MNKKVRLAALSVAVLLSGCTQLPPVSNQNLNSQPAQTSTNSDNVLKSQMDTEVTSGDLTYFETAKGFFARPTASGTYPGVILIHEWWGLNQQIKDVASELAKEGYLVLAVDLYNGKVAQTADEARGMTSSLDQPQAIQNMQAALTYLKDQGATKLASWGWCFGGGQSMQLSVSGQPLDATVIYYGNLATEEEKLKTIQWPVLGIFGDKDQSITPEKVQAFDASLDKLGVENEIHIYPGVGHAFANPSGTSYAPNETKDAWDKTLQFLADNLKQT